MSRLVLMILWCLLLLNAHAQEPPLQIQQQLEDLAGAMEDDLPEDGQYLQLLHHLKSHPLDINSAGAEQFNQLSFTDRSFTKVPEVTGSLYKYL